MLRMLLGEQPRQNNGLLEEAIESMVQTTRSREGNGENQDPTHDFRKLEIWTRG